MPGPETGPVPGPVPVLVWALRKHKKLAEVVDPGRSALIVVCHTEELQSAALKAGADPSWSPRASHRAPATQQFV